jgi:hypothetical protein
VDGGKNFDLVEFEPQVSLNSLACSSTLLVVLDLEFNRQLIFRQCSSMLLVVLSGGKNFDLPLMRKKKVLSHLLERLQ